MKRSLLFIILTLLTIIFCLFFVFFESYKDTKELGWSSKALQNKYLAAEQFLTTSGKSIDIAHGFSEINNLNQIDTLIITNYSDVVSKKQENALLTWMSNGGNLILVLPHNDSQDQDSELLNRVGITSYKIEEDGNTTNPDQSDAALNEPSTSLAFDGVEEELSIEFAGNSSLYHASLYSQDDEDHQEYKPFYWAGDDYGIRFIQMNINDGLLTVLSDASIWQNTSIRKYDHAHLLYLLSDSQNTVQFLVGSDFPSLISLMWKNTYELIISIFVLLLFWLFYRGKRFLPAITTHSMVRRSLNEHIEAVAKFHWKQNQSERLLASLREEALKKHSLLDENNNSSEHKITQSLSLLINRDTSIIEIALFSSKIVTEAEFIQAVQTLKTINSKL